MPKLSAMAYMRALPAHYKAKAREDAKVLYLAEALRIVGENTAKTTGGSYLSVKLIDVLEPKEKDTRSADEIAADIIQKAGLNFGLT